MPWDMNDYPASMKNLDPLVRKKAIDIANALETDGYEDERAIPIAQAQAGDWFDSASDEEKEAFKQEPDPQKDDSHDSSGNEDLIDNDVEVIFDEDAWKVKTVDAERADQTFEYREDAVARAEDVARNKESAVRIYKKDGTLQDERTPRARED